MGAAMHSMGSWRFGIEIELLISSKDKRNDNWDLVAAELSKLLRNVNIDNHIRDAADKSEHKYSKWSIVRERTIQANIKENLYGLELVSPVYNLTSPWREELTAIFDVIHAHFRLKPSAQCATHIHVSRFPALTTAELASAAKHALYFERALDALVAPHRRGGTHWARSNCSDSNPALRNLSLARRLSAIDAAVDKAAAAAAAAGLFTTATTGTSTATTTGTSTANLPLVQTLNLFDGHSALARSRGRTAHWVHAKVYKWDFAGTVPASRDVEGSGRGTVEYRQPQGSASAAEGVCWATLAVLFVAAAAAAAAGAAGAEVLEGVDEDGGSLEELEGFLAVGAGWLGMGSIGPVDRLILLAREGRLGY